MGDRTRRRIEGYLSRLLGYALSLTADRDSAQELVHECAIRSLSARRVPDDEPAYRAWLFRILRNVFLDQVRNAGRELAAPYDEPKAESSAVWDHDDRLISALTVRAAMARLAPHHREIVALVDLAGFSYGEAATILEVPQGTVMSRLSRARGALLDDIAEGNILPLEGRRVRK